MLPTLFWINPGRQADLNKVANLTRIFGFLMQTKVYLFWSKEARVQGRGNWKSENARTD